MGVGINIAIPKIAAPIEAREAANLHIYKGSHRAGRMIHLSHRFVHGGLPSVIIHKMK
jgi:hypothetical protein